MRLLIPALLSVTASCTPPAPSTPEDDAKVETRTKHPDLINSKGAVYETRLNVLDETHVVGKPLRLRLELTNHSSRRFTFNAQQVHVNRSIRIIGPDDKLIPYIYPSVQTVGSDQTLDPGETAVLFRDLDIARQYLVNKPGRYRVQYTGSGISEIIGILLPSNAVTVTLEPGEPTNLHLIADALMDILPKEWVFSIMGPPDVEGFKVRLRTRRRGKRPTAWIGLGFGPKPTWKGAKVLGTWREIPVYISAVPGTHQVWSGYSSKIQEALGIEVP